MAVLASTRWCLVVTLSSLVGGGGWTAWLHFYYGNPQYFLWTESLVFVVEYLVLLSPVCQCVLLLLVCVY